MARVFTILGLVTFLACASPPQPVQVVSTYGSAATAAGALGTPAPAGIMSVLHENSKKSDSDATETAQAEMLKSSRSPASVAE